MVSIDSPEEHEFIFMNINEWVWTGGYYSPNDKTWNWSDGTPWNYQYWFSNQPSSKGADSCRAVNIFSTLAMSPCLNRKKFICEKKASGAVEVASGDCDRGCPAGWKSKFGGCYRWFFTIGKTWQNAENHCQQLGVRIQTSPL